MLDTSCYCTYLPNINKIIQFVLKFQFFFVSFMYHVYDSIEYLTKQNLCNPPLSIETGNTYMYSY